MSIAPDAARDAILSVFKTVWDPRLAVYDDVPGSAPVADVVWARATIKHATGRQTGLGGIGSRRFTDEGTLTVQVFAPVGDGSTACYDAATEVRNAYRDARDPEVWFRDVRLNEIGDKDGSFDQINVIATFSYDDVR